MCVCVCVHIQTHTNYINMYTCNYKDIGEDLWIQEKTIEIPKQQALANGTSSVCSLSTLPTQY